ASPLYKEAIRQSGKISDCLCKRRRVSCSTNCWSSFYTRPFGNIKTKRCATCLCDSSCRISKFSSGQRKSSGRPAYTCRILRYESTCRFCIESGETVKRTYYFSRNYIYPCIRNHCTKQSRRI